MQNELRSDEFLSDAMEQHGDAVYRLALCRLDSRADAEDVFQEVFLRLLRDTTDFRDAEHLKAWLLRVTVNCCKKQFDNAYRKRTVPLDTERSGGESYEMKLPGSPVYDAVLELPDDYRSVIHLFYYEQYSVREIADILGLSESAVKTRLSRARGMLKNTLKGEV